RRQQDVEGPCEVLLRPGCLVSEGRDDLPNLFDLVGQRVVIPLMEVDRDDALRPIAARKLKRLAGGIDLPEQIISGSKRDDFGLRSHGVMSTVWRHPPSGADVEFQAAFPHAR